MNFRVNNRTQVDISTHQSNSKRFYVGNINNFGFGTWNSGVPMFKNNLRSTNINNNNNNVPYAAPTPASSNYNNSTAFPIPKTLYSMNNNNLAQSVTIPFKKTMDPNEKTLNSNFKSLFDKKMIVFIIYYFSIIFFP